MTAAIELTTSTFIIDLGATDSPGEAAFARLCVPPGAWGSQRIAGIGYELWQVTIVGIELWCDHLNNEPAMCSYTKLFPFGQVLIYLLGLMSATYFIGRFRNVNIF